jgi:hypothetical protein
MNDLDERWSRLQVPSAALHGFELKPGSGVWLSLDKEGRRCVLLRNDSDKPSGTLLFETKGVAASIEVLELADHLTSPWIVVVCRDYRYWEPFLAFADSLHEEMKGKQEDNVSLTLRVLRTWRWLWATDPDGLTRESAVGLVGELWFLIRWAGIGGALDAWCGPEGSLHDFVGHEVSVEVKASQSAAVNGPTHRITGLQQLTPLRTGKLYLFSVVIAPDNTAGNTLSKLVDIGLAALQNDPARREQFLQKLSSVGWAAPLSKQFDLPFRVVSEQLYEVGDTFPALTLGSFPNGMPAAVTAVSYALDMSHCQDWRVAQSAEEGRMYLEGLTL